MIEPAFSVVLRKLYNELAGSGVNWVVTGSLNFALQSLPLTPHDIDIQTDTPGAYEIERRFASYVTRKVAFSSIERIRSHFGALQIDGITVELMGDLIRTCPDVAASPLSTGVNERDAFLPTWIRERHQQSLDGQLLRRAQLARD